MSADEYVAVNYELWRRQPRTRRLNWLLYIALVLLTISLVLGIWQYVRNSAAEISWGFVPVWALAVAFAIWRPWQVKQLLRRGYAQNAGLHQPIDYQFDTKSIKGSSVAGTFETRWKALHHAVCVGDWLLLYPSQVACYYVDTRRVIGPATPDDLLELVHEQGLAVH
ncbi:MULTISPECIES: hypothetical protein [Hymenobacter]|uniref:YcxB family protein n=1 Tax=Hymenobacter jejuensis TaxID=2502781 RepID=A0A5B7ZW50_9BACT|nr:MULTISPECIES: hypothetical protein [Hymenobacter]MBC6988465.1 hypothetical protein [Hymenobacter sp. BT491]QDA59180.1 hypothetical protein FHG12_03255 [Hymenobacter jejuensis]